jgi:hypothetical protein
MIGKTEYGTLWIKVRTKSYNNHSLLTNLLQVVDCNDRNIDTWNKLADKINNPNVMKRKKNRYW